LRKYFDKTISPAVKYWVFLTGIVTVTFTVIFGSLTASYLNLAPQEQAVIETLSHKLIPFPFIGAIFLVAFIGTLVSLLFRSYIIPVLRMAEQTRLITAANPDFRISVKGAREVNTLAKVLNESADAFQKLRSEVDSKISHSNLTLKRERNRLATLMSDLPYGVIVCNRDGIILLYSRQAQEMLQVAESARQGGTIGLGRSIFGLLDRDPLVHTLEVMNHAFAVDQAKPALGLMTKLCGNRFIRVNMAPITDDDESGRQLSGFVLSLEDITDEIDADSERDKLLQGMIDAVQNSLGKLHQGINRICAMPGTGEETCKRHRQAINQVTSALEEHLALARKLYSGHRRAYGNQENVIADTLLTLIAKNLYERFAIQTETSVDRTIWLKIDSYAIVQAFTTLTGLLNAEYSVTSIKLQLDEDQGSRANLRLQWQDQTVPAQAIHDWQTSPLFMDSDGAADSPLTVIAAHQGGISIIESGEGFCTGISVSLPTALAEEPADLQSSVSPRPVSYEFDLFHQPGQEALGKVALRKLVFVAFDTETTGLNPSKGDEIIQLGAVRIVNGRLLHHECIDQLVNPQRPVPKSSVAIHGIDSDLLPSQPTITEILPDLHAFAIDSVLVAHNAAFDMRFLQLKEEVSGVHFDNPVLDTLLLSSIVHPHQEGHSLDAIAERFNITIVGRHTALGDALVTAEVLLKLMPLLEAQGIITLQDALNASLKSPFAKIKY